ncbi:DUF4815 domain-containing protein [Mycolicibacterium rufum]|uniref:DUF4815 domain-containing protein n=3 Tax=Mycolicibacterium rufum TaxID=318424 RepID=A0ABY3UL20_9MYCO|nr:DUF6519 domain-containing protein [Mycolicibacterium rufum]KGI67133.1 hypothetical protein EU78_06295 [Mycolicibacterium rufum]ULP38002.1 DUF4815 domain-containing protein [Mycolicibacterium rufum]
MHADITRDTFDRARHFTSVRYQQGRLPLDADLNEASAILRYQLRTMMADFLGHIAVPDGAAGFQIATVKPGPTITDVTISPGRAYVDGILIENENEVTYTTQPDGYLDPDNPDDAVPDTVPFAVYLRVWERLITAWQDPAIREIALGDPGPDTAARSKVVWQVGLLPLDGDGSDGAKQFDAAVAEFNPAAGLLAARARRPLDYDKDPCHLPPEAKFRGPENQLYRVEVHSGGPAWNPDAEPDGHGLRGATFTWSRENGSVVLPIRSVKGATVVLSSLGRDNKLGLEIGDWVEITDDAAASRIADDHPLTETRWWSPLHQIAAIDYEDRSITLTEEVTDDTGSRPQLHPLVRRWDHVSPTLYDSNRVNVAADGALPLMEGMWIALEDGVEVQFRLPTDADPAGAYRGGNYWMIPARTVTGDAEWPQGPAGPSFEPPEGIEYHYALLGTVKANSIADKPKKFKPLT